MIRVIILTFAAATVASGQFLQCPWVSSLDCRRYPIQYLCGTDSITYENRCDFAKVQCNNHNLHIIGYGTCISFGIAAVTSTSAPLLTTVIQHGPTTTHKPVFLGHNVVRDFFCLELMHENCPKDTERVCGNDTVTYDNFCEFEKATCTHDTLGVSHYGQC